MRCGSSNDVVIAIFSVETFVGYGVESKSLKEIIPYRNGQEESYATIQDKNSPVIFLPISVCEKLMILSITIKREGEEKPVNNL